MPQGTYRGTLTDTDYVLAEVLAAHVVEVAGGSTDTFPGNMELDLDEMQDGPGWTFDVGRNPASNHMWRRYNGYQAEDWPQVKTAILQLAADEAFIDAL